MISDLSTVQHSNFLKAISEIVASYNQIRHFKLDVFSHESWRSGFGALWKKFVFFQNEWNYRIFKYIHVSELADTKKSHRYFSYFQRFFCPFFSVSISLCLSFILFFWKAERGRELEYRWWSFPTNNFKRMSENLRVCFTILSSPFAVFMTEHLIYSDALVKR